DLMKFYTNEHNQTIMALANSEIPANLAADKNDLVASKDSIAGYAAQATLGVALPNTPYMSALWKPVADALTAIWNGTQTPEAALTDAQTKAETEVAKLK